MRISAPGLELIRAFEGFSPTAYLCPANLWTIGYGHVLRGAMLAEKLSLRWSEADGEAQLQSDCRVFERAVSRLIHVPLSQPQFDALVAFTYNVGSAALQRSTLRQRLNRGEYTAVPSEMMRWVHAGGRRLAGLERRRRAEAALFAED
jgi:lysozyme